MAEQQGKHYSKSFCMKVFENNITELPRVVLLIIIITLVGLHMGWHAWLKIYMYHVIVLI